MAEAEQRASIGVVLDGPSGQRFADRLARSGVPARVVSREMFERQASAGQVYVAPLSLWMLAQNVARRGAHVVLTPPWPVEALTIGGGAIGGASTEHRGAARYTSAFAAKVRPGASSSLRILYRERLAGSVGVVLVESEVGEPLLATLPRTSNRHAYVTVTTLQVVSSSAQTRFDDVARLIGDLVNWCVEHAEPMPAHAEPTRQDDELVGGHAEEAAHLVLLALALAAPALRDVASDQIAVPQERLRRGFDQISHYLGLTSDPTMFAEGWVWLKAHGVVSDGGEIGAVAAWDAIERYSAAWQLGSRIRRLRQIGGVAW